MTCPKCGGTCQCVQPRSRDVTVRVLWCPVCKIAFEEKDGLKIALFNDKELKDHFNLSQQANELSKEFPQMTEANRAMFLVLITNFALQQWMDGFKTGVLLGLRNEET